MTKDEIIEDLREQVAYLKGQLGQLVSDDQLTKLRKAWGLTPQEARIVLALHAAGGKVCSKDYLLSALYDNPDTAAEEKIIDVFVCKARRKLDGRNTSVSNWRGARRGEAHDNAPYQGMIQNVWGQGYCLTPTALARVNQLLDVMPSEKAA